MCDMTGYEPQTTFWNDFTIAEQFGLDAIRDTFDRTMNEWKDNYIYLTELVMYMNWNLWYWDGAGTKSSEKFAELYRELFEEADLYAIDHLKDDELSYFLRTVD